MNLGMFKRSIACLAGLASPFTPLASRCLAAPSGGVFVPAQFVENHIYVSVKMAGIERPWILDCGAGGSVIDQGLATELGLKRSGEAQAIGAAGSVKTAFVTVPAFSVGGVESDSQPMVVLDVAGLLQRVTGTAAAGVLGYDFFSRFVTRVDFAGQTVTFYRPESFDYRGPGSTIPMHTWMNLPTVEMRVEDSLSGPWRLDIGAAVSVFHHNAVERSGLAQRSGVERVATGMGGTQRHRLVQFANAELAGFKVDRPLISVPLEAGPGALAAANVVGTLGNSILHNFVLYLDYNGGRLIVEKGAGFGKPYVPDRSGLQVMQGDSGRFEVTCAATGTPAEKAGFRAGDVVTAIDGRGPEEIGGLLALRRMLRADAGKTYEFKVARQDTTLRLKLTLEDLFPD